MSALAEINSKVTVKTQATAKIVKCVVWDLDHTLWQGVLLEDNVVYLKHEVAKVIKILDKRGILQSIASKNNYGKAKEKLQEFALWDYFLCPKISFNTKSDALSQIANDLNVGLDTFVFVDDQPFEREEVRFTHPQVQAIDAADCHEMLKLTRMQPSYLSDETSKRRQLYQEDFQRRNAEQAFIGPSTAFLASLNMQVELAQTTDKDLGRAQELIQRTNQLNTTGYTYSFAQLQAFSKSIEHLSLVATLTDDFGSYGTIGFALIEKGASFWTIKLLLMSCRVMSRGIGSIMIHNIMSEARQAGVLLRAEYLSNDKNRQMYITYKFAGFKQLRKVDDTIILEHELEQLQPLPPYVDVKFRRNNVVDAS